MSAPGVDGVEPTVGICALRRVPRGRALAGATGGGPSASPGRVPPCGKGPSDVADQLPEGVDVLELAVDGRKAHVGHLVDALQ